jgi:hypothetical protein
MTPSTAPLHAGELALLLEQHPSGPCWGGKLYLGSMMLLDFGSRLLVARPHGSVYVGGTSLSLRSAYWEITRQGQLILAADAAEPPSFEEVAFPLLQNQSIGAIRPMSQSGVVQFVFSNGVSLDLDVTGKWQTEDALAELALRDGRYVEFRLNGEIVLTGDRDLVRKHAYESALRERGTAG